MKAVLLVVLLFAAIPVFPQCSWSPRESMPFRATAFDVAIDAPYVWVATGYGVQLLENQGTRAVDVVAVPGSTRVVRADGHGVAYVGSGTRVFVLQRNGRNVSVVRSVDTGATVNDILIAGSYLFVATANGLLHYDVIDPLNPIRTNATLLTSAPNVTSLAVIGPRLFAADGDATIEIYSISIPSIPQHTGDLATIARAAYVHASPDQVLYVSDAFGQNTDLFVGGAAHLGRLSVGSMAFAAYNNTTQFVAGADRTIRAVDFSSTSVVKEQFEHQLLPTGGTDNAIHAMARDGNTLYVAAGDIGLVTMDLGTLGPPYPVVSYTTTPMTSVVMRGDLAWFADATGVVTQQRIVGTGIALTTDRTWNGGTLVHDADTAGVLTSNGATASIYSLDNASLVATATFRAAVKNAAIVPGPAIVALLTDGSVWKSATSGGPTQIALPNMSQLVRGGTRLVFVELRNDGSTWLHAYPVDNLAAPPLQHVIDGVAIGRIATDGTRAAVFTFQGVTIVDLLLGSQRVVAGSNAVLPLQLAFAGDDLLVLDQRTLHVYDDARTLIREQYLPADAVAVAADANVAVIASSDGPMAALVLAKQPTSDIPFESTFYSKVVAGGDRVYLMSPDTIDIYSTADSNAPRYIGGIPTSGVIDVAALPNAFYTLSAAGVVTAYSRQGARIAQTTINEGSDAQMLNVDVAGNAVWVSLSKGCTTGTCQKKTLVLDPTNLGVTSSMNGGVTDVTASATRAYALFDFPAEVRVLNITDPLHPAQLVATNAPANATSIAATGGKVYVTAEKVYQFAEATLVQQTTYLTTVTPDKAQTMRIDGNCAVITARSANPEQYNATTMAPTTSFDVPANVRGIALQPGRLLLLTTHSLEVWAAAATQEPGKRRTAR